MVVSPIYIQSGLQGRLTITLSFQVSATNESLETMCPVLWH